jgi:COMPASS component SWD2
MDNKYLRFFRGHSAKVVSISMNPVNDNFLSASSDGVVHHWDLSSTKPLGRLNLPDDSSQIRVSYDTKGEVFAVMCRHAKTNKQSIKLYASNEIQNGPFMEICPEEELIRSAISKAHPPVSPMQAVKYLQAVWTDLEFSPDGKFVLINTNSDFLLTLDAFNPTNEPFAITSRKNESGLLNLGCCYSADGRFIIAANEGKEIIVYDVKNHSTVTILK